MSDVQPADRPSSPARLNDGQAQEAWSEMLMEAEPRVHGSLCPPAPSPHARPLGPIGLLKALWRNPLEAWTDTYFEQPVVTVNLPIGKITVVSDPQAVRRVLLENAANYRKDGFQRRMMSATLGNGLLLAEEEQWRVQRRTIAPRLRAQDGGGLCAGACCGRPRPSSRAGAGSRRALPWK